MKIKYAMCVGTVSPEIEKVIEEYPRRSGLYNWVHVFDGVLARYQDIDPNDYDVIQVNGAPTDMPMFLKLRNLIKNSSTVLVLNNDYVTELWDNWGFHPMQYLEMQKMADCVFGTEKMQVSHMVDGTVNMPHPTYTKQFKMLKWKGEKDNAVGTIYHSWNPYITTPSILMMKLKEKHKLLSRLYAFKPQPNDKMAKWTRQLFDEVHSPMPFKEYIMHLMSNKAIYEYCVYHTYGRTSVETAAMGVPTFGSNTVFSMRKCFPELCCNPLDLKSMKVLAEKCLKQNSWVEEQINYAKEKAEYFNYKNSKERYMKMIEGVKK